MAQPPAYNREKNFTLNSGRETDHAALNAELDKASNSINDIRTNLAILQADDGKLRPSVVTPDSISDELRVSLVEGVVMDAQAVLDESRKASETSKSSAEKAKESETKAAASEKAAAAFCEQAQAIAGDMQKRADDIVHTASDQAKEYARSAQTSALEAEKQAQASAGSAASADRSAEEAAFHAAIAGQRGIPVGTVVMFTAAEPPAGYLKCDGSAVGRATCPELYAAIGTTCGEGDGETTFNLPDLIGRFAEGSATPGTVKEAGLPNIEAYWNVAGVMSKSVTSSGAAIVNRFSPNVDYSGTGSAVNDLASCGFKASQYNGIYGNSDTVQPPALTLLPCIKAFDAAVDSGLIDITELANEVAGKADKTQVANLAMPSEKKISLSVGESDTSYIAPAAGYVKFGARQDGVGEAMIGLYNVNTSFSSDYPLSLIDYAAMVCTLQVRKGDTFSIYRYGNLHSLELTFFYAEGSQP